MEHFYKFLIVLSTLYLVTESLADDNVEAMKKALFDVCSNKYPISDAIKNDAKKGILSEDRNFKCFMMCSLDELSLINPETAEIDGETMISMMPNEEVQKHIKPIIDQCLPNIAGKPDACEVAYNFVKCGLTINPSATMILPF
ncbi:uncharacterized protein LOC126834440 [Adelges cooleyi]|uniref:uncharacterized protein LOC126834440 n=1 Tax=Adelges cooleyi TaxID=133065 RepID=UPI00218063F7|nr:uncharacterized protein LOC126834440 [Adelges cooleyi]